MMNKIREASARRAAGEEGFTLIELLVVVVILVALAAIAIPIFLNQKTKAEQSGAQTTVSNIGSAISGGLGTSSLTGWTLASGTAGTDNAKYSGTLTTDAGSVNLGTATVYANTASNAFCVSLTGGGTSYKFTSSNPAVVAGAACADATG